MASAASRLGFMVLTPTRPVPLSTSSRVWASLRFGSAERDSHTGMPGVFSPSMAPGLGQWAVTWRAVVQAHVGEEALVAVDQGPARQGGAKSMPLPFS